MVGKDDRDERVLVHVRVRPLTSVEDGQNVVVSSNGRHKLLLQKDGRGQARTFSFDRVYWSLDGGDSFDGQRDVYLHVGKLMLDHAFAGFNTCIFAYGQTGSGKTYTMMGDSRSHEADDRGIIPRACSDLFDLIDQNYTKVADGVADAAPDGANPIFSYEVTCSYYEIYNERVFDLLEPKKENLRVREHPSLGPYVENLSVSPVCVYDEVQSLLIAGNRYRHTNSTKLNERSSRSHAIFTITLKQSRYQGGELSEYISRINLVDLAGSERTKNAGTSGETLTEGININKSLCTLGSVIHNLAESHEKQRQTYINFRDSNLTWLLRENLGGNSKTIMVATVSPSSSSYDESLNTLRYADRVKQIRQKAIVNEDSTTRLIRDLRQEVAHLRRENMEVARLKHEIHALQQRGEEGQQRSAAAAAAAAPATAAAPSSGVFRAGTSPYIVVLRPNPSGRDPVICEIRRHGVYITDPQDAVASSLSAKAVLAAHPELAVAGQAPEGVPDTVDVLKMNGAPRGAALIVLNERNTSSVFATNRPCTLISLAAPCQVLDSACPTPAGTAPQGACSNLFHGCFFTLAGAIVRFVDPTAADHEADRLLWLQSAHAPEGQQPAEEAELDATACPDEAESVVRVYSHAQQRAIVDSLSQEQRAMFQALAPREQQAFLAQQLTPSELKCLDSETQQEALLERDEMLRDLAGATSSASLVEAVSSLSLSAVMTFDEQQAFVNSLTTEEQSIFAGLTPQGQRAFLSVQQQQQSGTPGTVSASTERRRRDLLLLRAEEQLRGAAAGEGDARTLDDIMTSAPPPQLTLSEEAAIVEALPEEDRVVFESLSALDQQRFFATQPRLEGDIADESEQGRIAVSRRQVLHALRDASQELAADDPPLPPLALRAKQALVAALPEGERDAFNLLSPQEQQSFLEKVRAEADVRPLAEGGSPGRVCVDEVAQCGGEAVPLTLSEQVAIVGSLPPEQQELFHGLPAAQQQSFLAAYAAAIKEPLAEEAGGAGQEGVPDGLRIERLHSRSAELLRGLELEAEGQALERPRSFTEQVRIVRAALPEELQQKFDELSPSSQKAFLRGHVSALQHAALSDEAKAQYALQQASALETLSVASVAKLQAASQSLLGVAKPRRVVKTLRTRAVRDKDGNVTKRTLVRKPSVGGGAPPAEGPSEREVELGRRVEELEAALAQQAESAQQLQSNEVVLRERLQEEEGLLAQMRSEREDEKLLTGLKVEEVRKELVAKENIIKEVRDEMFADREHYEKLLQEMEERSNTVFDQQVERLQQNEECVRILEYQYQETQAQHEETLKDKDTHIADLQAEVHASSRAMCAERHDSECLRIQNQVLEEKCLTTSNTLRKTAETHANLVQNLRNLEDQLSENEKRISSLTSVCDDSHTQVKKLVAENDAQTKAVEEKGREIVRLKEVKQQLAREAEEKERLSQKQLLGKQMEMDRLKRLADERELARAAVETQCAMLRERVEVSLDDVSRLHHEMQDIEMQMTTKEEKLKSLHGEKEKLAESYARETEEHRNERTRAMKDHQERIRSLNEQLSTIQSQAREMQEKNRGLYYAQERIRERRQRLQTELEQKEAELRETKMKYREAHLRLQSTLKKGKKEQKNLNHLRRLTTVVKEQEARIDYLQRELRESQALSRRLEEGHAATYSQEQVQAVREDVFTTLAALKSEVIQFTPPVLRQVQTMANSVQHSVDPRRIFRQAFNHVRQVVTEISGKDLPLDGGPWQVDESQMGRMKPFQRASVLKALREIVVWHGVSPDYTRQEMANFLELTKNAGFLICMARFCQNPSMPDFSSSGPENRLDLNLRPLILAGRRGGAGRDNASVASRRSPPPASASGQETQSVCTQHMPVTPPASVALVPRQRIEEPAPSPVSPPERPHLVSPRASPLQEVGASMPPNVAQHVVTSVLPMRHSLSLSGMGKMRSFDDTLIERERERERDLRSAALRSTSAAAPSTARTKKKEAPLASTARSSSVSPLLTMREQRLSPYDEPASYSAMGHSIASYGSSYALALDRYERDRPLDRMNVITANPLSESMKRRQDDSKKKNFMQGTVSSQGKEVNRGGFPLAAQMMTTRRNVRFTRPSSRPH